MEKLYTFSFAALFMPVMGINTANAERVDNKGYNPGSYRYQKNSDACHRIERDLSKKEIRILSEAKLIRRGNPNIEVGKIEKTRNGYTVSIITKKHSDLVKNIYLTDNGLPFYVSQTRKHQCFPYKVSASNNT